MPEMKSSGLMLERVKEILDAEAGQIATSNYGMLLRAPAGGLGEKLLLVGRGDQPADAQARCLAIIQYLRDNGVPVTIWHDLLNEYGAVIIDKLSLKQMEIFQEYAPDAST